MYARLQERLGPVTELLRTHRFAEEDLARTKTDAIEVYRIRSADACEDLALLRRRLRTLERDIDRTIQAHEVGPC